MADENSGSMTWFKQLKYLGPGLLVAATGVGAGDLVAASVGGANFGYTVLWSALLGALFKYALNEGVARWQLDSGKTIIEGWRYYFPAWVSYYFLVYLVIWSFIVGAALSGAVGLAAHAIFPIFSVAVWGIIHAVLAFFLVLFFKYSFFEKIMKLLIIFMFSLVIINTILSQPDWLQVWKGISFIKIPKGSIWLILGIIGGVGGSVTILSYAYWIREKNWTHKEDMKKVKIDLIIAYLLTAFFGLAVMVIAADVKPEAISGNKMVLSLAEKIGETSGYFGEWVFLLGFWAAVFSSMLGVWQGVPFLFADFMQIKNKSSVSDATLPKVESSKNVIQQKYYRYFLFFLAFPPLVLLFLQKPVWIIISYAVIGSFFMPFLAFTLYYLNNKHNKYLKAPRYINILLVLAFLLFAFLMGFKIYNMLL